MDKAGYVSQPSSLFTNILGGITVMAFLMILVSGVAMVLRDLFYSEVIVIGGRRDMSLQDWIDSKLAVIADKLPTLVNTEPASFSCGYNTGYKQAILDLDKFLEDEATE
jgi:hypothetical protein